ncbi:MAG TPA: alkaline phosphatase family protein [Bacteroidota bacterium]|nr:alkaline phosphatase family protein [Bacteroidota bacterium]
MRTLSLIILMLFLSTFCLASSPNLIIVISLDQFPEEYLTRFRPWFHGGLANLLDHGAMFVNANYDHAQCTTGPGHAVLLTGCYADMNGIVANTWLDRTRGQAEYCVDDRRSAILGATGYGASPRNLLQPSFGDMLRLHTSFVSKVISISNKDRAAILLGGRLANAAYWMIDSSFVSSTYYMPSLPKWVERFNASRAINRCFGGVWEQTLPDSAFNCLDRDNVPYETDQDSLGRAFPHRVTGRDRSRLTPSYYGAMVTSPFGAFVLTDFVERAIVEEHLGKRGVTDLLCVSYSSTDYVGHAFGPHSHEVLEMASAIDRTLNDLFTFVDSTVGLGKCVIALSSDHGIAPIPEFVKSRYPGADAGRVQTEALRASSEAAMNATFGVAPANDPWILSISDHNVYLNRPRLSRADIKLIRAAEVVKERLLSLPGVSNVWNLTSPTTMGYHPWDQRVLRSFYPERSGDLFYVLKPLYIEGEGDGTTHGDPYQYNTHVPLILMGPQFRGGQYTIDVSPADLAPTLSAATGIEFPTGREGCVLWQAIK